jgi:serine/threonine protein kinase
VYIVESTVPALPGISALKTVRRDRMAAETLNRFHDEAAIWSALPHSVSILPAYGVTRYNGVPYIRTKYIPAVVNCAGPSVEHLIDRFVVDARILYGILLEVAAVMATLRAKDQYFSHGDLKPANILLDRLPKDSAADTLPGQTVFPYVPLVSDFGLARAFHTRDSSGFRGGDLRYIAPEVLQSEAYDAVRADVYSFGATAVHMLLNRPMRRGDSDQGMSLDEVSRAFAEGRPEIPGEVRRLFESCLETDPGNRPDAFSAIAKQLAEHSGSSGVRLERHVFKNRSSGSEWLDQTIRSSPLMEYLQSRRGLNESEASDIASWIGKAASLRASSRIAEAKELTDCVLTRLPEFPPALAGEAYGCTLDNRPRRAVNLYLLALHGYMEDPDLLDADSKCFAGACSTLAQNIAKVWLELTPEERRRLGEPVRKYAKLGRLRMEDEARSWLSEGIAELIIGNDLEDRKSVV